MAAIYAADIFCDDCADRIKEQIARDIRIEGIDAFLPDNTTCREHGGFDEFDDLVDYLEGMDERHYDSDFYPKWCSDDAESDSPQHCGSHDDCVNYGELADGFRYGFCFGNSLTGDGEDYVKEAVREGDDGGIAREVWAVEYDYLDFDERDDNDDYNDCGH